MPEKKTLKKSRSARSRGNSASTQAGPFVEEEMRHKKTGKHPVKSRKQAIAIGLSKARKSGVKMPAQSRPKRKPRKKSRAGRQHK
jgi:hypothetical protein